MSSLLEGQVKSQDIYRQSTATIGDELLESFRELEIQDLIQNRYGKGYGKDLTPRQLAISRQTSGQRCRCNSLSCARPALCSMS
jgi:hypothetical protein